MSDTLPKETIPVDINEIGNIPKYAITGALHKTEFEEIAARLIYISKEKHAWTGLKVVDLIRAVEKEISDKDNVFSWLHMNFAEFFNADRAILVNADRAIQNLINVLFEMRKKGFVELRPLTTTKDGRTEGIYPETEIYATSFMIEEIFRNRPDLLKSLMFERSGIRKLPEDKGMSENEIKISDPDGDELRFELDQGHLFLYHPGCETIDGPIPAMISQDMMRELLPAFQRFAETGNLLKKPAQYVEYALTWDGLADFLRDQRKWSENTFGPDRRTEGNIKHIEKEFDEIRKDPADPSEWVDVIKLGFDGYLRAGGNPETLLADLWAKQRICKARKWPKPTSEYDPVEHVREPSE